MKTGEIIKELRLKLGLTQQELADKVGYTSRSSINKIETCQNGISQSKILNFANALGVSPDALFDMAPTNSTKKCECSNVSAIYADNFYNIPVYASASAGFGAYACSDIIDYISIRITNPADVPQTIAIKVKGDSMYPKIEDGDTIVVHKQDTVDSGSLAVVLLDGEEALVKKVEYGETWIDLVSINPEYQTRHFENEEVLRLKVVGLVKKIEKNV